jgi:hypothetical protein
MMIDDDDDDWYHGKTPKWCPFLLEKIHRFRTGKMSNVIPLHPFCAFRKSSLSPFDVPPVVNATKS